MLHSSETLFALLRFALGTERPEDAELLCALTQEEWQDVYDLAVKQNVLAIAFDGLSALTQKVPTSCLTGKRSNPDGWSNFVMEWSANLFYQEQQYEHYSEAVKKLARFYAERDIQMMVLKGYGLSLVWPVPEHRPVGDIDVYLSSFPSSHYMGDDRPAWKRGDEEIGKLGIKVERGEHHHTKFKWMGYSVENHYDFINRFASREAAKLDDELKRIAASGNHINKEPVWIPSANLHACFLLKHEASHFSATSLNLRQLLDWACFFRAHHEDVDKALLSEFAERFGMAQFLPMLNAACVKMFGLPEDIFVGTNCDEVVMDRFIADIIQPEFDEGNLPRGFMKKWAFRYRRWKQNAWKRRLVAEGNPYLSVFRLAWSHVRKPEV